MLAGGDRSTINVYSSGLRLIKGLRLQVKDGVQSPLDP